MKLKPGLFQLIVLVMTVSLLASCATTPEARQSDCISTTSANPKQQPNNCSPSSNGSGRSSGYSGGSSITRPGFGDSSEAGTSNGSSKGRSGFGSFGRGGHAGG
ncbi:MAG: hypothetical protein RM049_16680 [Nostoc sp. DedQUE04]|uniref:hypothetical protein n=1 Tax=Nostoc sp. DedQUE04 TaxID=3075390 RepID=UPI002AD21E2D|nr:hypothetical protein [Nostoc sp. DedQUE04]MDZ8136919.1 hypothetical protein [Nostoc sp. DedQUE04]